MMMMMMMMMMMIMMTQYSANEVLKELSAADW
jgi:hypothetical protein